MGNRLATFWRRHESFLLIFILFAAFRLLATWLWRPGGFIADASDYDFYIGWGELVASGYKTFEDLWSAYPPLFASLVIPIYELSARIPPWIDPRLAFHTLFGAFLLIFECGNLVLIYRLAGKVYGDSVFWYSGDLVDTSPTVSNHPITKTPLHPVLFYALLFVPVHNLLGWFEAMPLFFLLLALDLLLATRPAAAKRSWGWIGSAVAMGLGFLVKLTPIILLPVAIRWLGAKLSWKAAREEWFNPRSPGNLLRPALYTLIAAATIVGAGWWLVGGNWTLGMSSLTVNAIRPPWQSIWALLDGYWGFGWVPVDIRNLGGLETVVWQTRLPWVWITLAFGLLYLWLYTRPYDWSQAETVIAFTGVSVIWLLLWSKGWSPQFLIWVLAFIVLLLPNVRGVLLALALTFLNVVEAYIYLTLLPNERWILVATVILRAILFVIVAVEFLALIWRTKREPDVAPLGFQRWAHVATWVALAATLIVGVVGAPRAAQAYGERRLAESPCYDAIRYLQQQAVDSPLTTKIAMTEIEVWRNLYPWLRDDYDLRLIDSYAADDAPADATVSARLRAWVGNEEFWWLYTDHAPEPTPQNLSFFDDEATRTLSSAQMGDCHIERTIRLPGEGDGGRDLASADVGAGPALGDPDGAPGAIELRQIALGNAVAGSALPVVLYWQATGAVPDSWTVFTQLFDGAGALVAQQDNIPVQGLAPTNTWELWHLVRDPYTLEIPAGASGPFMLHVGLYNAAGERAPITMADGSASDHIPVAMP